jgi:DNA-binding MarR family transcriptional regulator
MKIESFFPYQLAVVAAQFSRQLGDVYRRDGGLSREEWRVLFLLANAERLTSKELSLRSSLDKVQISRAAQRLETRGLISGTGSTQDRRLRDYSCTPEGRELFVSLFPRVEERAKKIFARMSSDDLAALKRGVAALNAATKADR